MKLKRGISAAALTAALALGMSVQSAELGDTSKPIKLAINEWTGQHISTLVAGEILKRMGYKVDYVTAGYFPQMQAMQDGTLSASLEIWSNNIGDHYIEAEKTGKVEGLGDLMLETNEGWIYPKFMEQKCPGLPDWEALEGCAEVLAIPETFPSGRILSYPADWGTRSADMIRGLDLPYEAIPAGSEDALVAELKSAALTKAALLMMFWAPHWVLAEVDVGWVKLPKWDAKCAQDASWGPNPNAVNDCGVNVAIPFKVAWSGMKDQWPAAYKFLKAFEMHDTDQIPMMAAVDVRGEDLAAVTKAWVDANEAKWKPWVDAAKM